MLDPGSVVRESEFALAATAGSYGARIKGLVDKINSGKFLETSIRNDFINRAGSLYKSRSGQYAKTEGQYRTLSTRNGLNPDNVVLDHGQPQQGQASVNQDDPLGFR